jgi:hemolysin activation/secretion protein
MKLCRSCLYLFALILPILIFGDAGSDSPEKIYSVSRIELEYAISHPEEIPLDQLERIEVPLFEKNGILYGKKREGSQRIHTTIQRINEYPKLKKMSDDALAAVLSALFQKFHRLGYNWTFIYIPTTEITQNGTDVRTEGDKAIKIIISTPMVTKIDVDSKNGKLTKKICDHLPISLPDPSSGYPGGWVNSSVLNNYLHNLNRYRDRRIDLEIGPTSVPGEVDLNFVVSEERPWHFYINANNNVPKPIHRWQEAAGFVHTQFTGNDDIFKCDAASDSFDKYYTFDASYEAPLGNSIDTRYKIFGSYSRFESAEFALPQNLFIGTQAIGNLEFITNIAQWGKLFLDFVGQMEYRHIHNRGHFLFSSATKNFLLPEVGLKLIQLKRETKLIASLTVQSTISSLFWNVKKNLDDLGRRGLSTNWGIVQAGLYGSFYLESLFHDTQKVQRLANEIVFVSQLQNAFNQRLIPELEGILGGLYTIRGYPQSTVAGDNLYMGSLEYRFHLPQAFKPNPRACTNKFRWVPDKPKGQADWDLIFRAFYDVGETTVNQRRSFEKDHLLMGVGVGLELVIRHNVFIRADGGHALRAANGIKKNHNQYYGSATIIF